MNKTSITIGNEYDKELILVLSKVLQDLNAIKIDENTGLAARVGTVSPALFGA